MNRTSHPLQLLCILGLITALGLLPAESVEALFGQLAKPEPTPRPTATVAPFLEVNPSQEVGNRDVQLTVTGSYWPVGGPGITLYWDVPDNAHLLAGPFQPSPDGSFSRQVTVPATWATPGVHKVIASDGQGFLLDAPVLLLEPTNTPTPTWTPTPSPTVSPSDTNTPTPETPTPTGSPTVTPTPSPTLRPITPVPSGTVLIPQPTLTQWPRPTATRPPPVATATLQPIVTFTPVAPPTDTLTPSVTPTYSPTPTPSDTPSPTPTPGPGTPSVTPEPTATETPEVDAGLPVTGGTDESTILGGFVTAILIIALSIVFLLVALVTALVAMRFWRMRRVQGEG